MAELTGLFGVDWATVFFVLLGVAFVVMSVRRDLTGTRIGPFLVIPLLAGSALVAAVIALRADDISRFLPFLSRPITITLVVAVGFVAIAVADLLFSRLSRIPGALWRSASRSQMADLGMVVFVGGTVVVGVLAMSRLTAATGIEPPPGGLGIGLAIDSTYTLPSAPLDIELRSERDGYVSLGAEVAHFTVPEDGGGLGLRTVAGDFTYSRGLAIVDDVLFVADLGPLPCPDPYPICKGHDVPGVDLFEGERRILEESRAQLLAFDIESDGSLTGRRVVLDALPVANTEHGVNDVVAGPDGRIYIAIGHLDHLPLDQADQVQHPNKDILGTVIRLLPDGSDVEIYATGLRNVYGLAFDDRGQLWGVDNDGETPNGWRAEELLHIREGRNYGYPEEGSFGDLRVRDDFPIWHVEGPGSAGILWADDVGLGPGMLIGSFGSIDGLRLTELRDGWGVYDRGSYAELIRVPGFVSAMKALGGGRVLVASGAGYAPGAANHALYVLSVVS
jgi:hypothetical protein